MELKDRSVLVMGLGRFGGGVGVTRYLARQGARVLVTDTAPADQLRTGLDRLADLPGIRYRLGEHREADFTSADLVVVNPAVNPATNRYVLAAAAAGVELTSEIRLLAQRLPRRERVIGITGTAGKSTVTAMIGHVLRKTPPTPAAEPRSGEAPDRPAVWVGGNIGGSLLDRIDEIGPNDWVVLELSSFMLEGLREERWSPGIAVITNLSPNHLDWHGSFEAYRDAKRAIFEFHRSGPWGEGDRLLLGPGVAQQLTADLSGYTQDMRSPTLITIPDPPWPHLTEADLAVAGRHNRLNAHLALCVCTAFLGLDRRAAERAIADFPGLPHRLQLVAEHAGVRYFNDSKSTTPDAARLAIESFAPGTVHAILGGYDKGSDLTALARVAAERCRAVYTIGATGQRIAEAVEAEAPGGDWQSAVHGPSADFGSCGSAGWGDTGAEVVRCDQLEKAVREAVQRVQQGDVVLLSPGCASWDQFENFEKRGARFTEAVLRHTSETGAAPS